MTVIQAAFSAGKSLFQFFFVFYEILATVVIWHFVLLINALNWHEGVHIEHLRDYMIYDFIFYFDLICKIRGKDAFVHN